VTGLLLGAGWLPYRVPGGGWGGCWVEIYLAAAGAGGVVAVACERDAGPSMIVEAIALWTTLEARWASDPSVTLTRIACRYRGGRPAYALVRLRRDDAGRLHDPRWLALTADAVTALLDGARDTTWPIEVLPP